MSRSIGLFALLAIAVLTLIAVIGVTRPARVGPPPPGSPAEDLPVAGARIDAGSLDSLVDGIHVEHFIKHGR